MVWYNNPESVKAIREGQYETVHRSDRRLLKLVRNESVAV